MLEDDSEDEEGNIKVVDDIEWMKIEWFDRIIFGSYSLDKINFSLAENEELKCWKEWTELIFKN